MKPTMTVAGQNRVRILRAEFPRSPSLSPLPLRLDDYQWINDFSLNIVCVSLASSAVCQELPRGNLKSECKGSPQPILSELWVTWLTRGFEEISLGTGQNFSVGIGTTQEQPLNPGLWRHLLFYICLLNLVTTTWTASSAPQGLKADKCGCIQNLPRDACHTL